MLRDGTAHYLLKTLLLCMKDAFVGHAQQKRLLVEQDMRLKPHCALRKPDNKGSFLFCASAFVAQPIGTDTKIVGLLESQARC